MSQHPRLPILLVIALLAASLAAACSPAKPAIRVGSKDFTEQFIIAEMYAQLLENAGFAVERQFNLPGSTAHDALVQKRIDLYPEYTGTALLTILKLPTDSDPQRVYDTVAKAYADRFNAAWLDPAPMNNTQALAMTKPRATQLEIVTLNDLAARARLMSSQGAMLKMAGPVEFLEREDGLPGLSKMYGQIPVDFIPAPPDERYERAASGGAEVVIAFGTDGEIIGADLALLIDDEGFFPPYQVAPVVRQPVLDANPDLRSALDALAPRLNTDALRLLNFQVSERQRPAADVAREFLQREGLLPARAGSPPPAAGLKYVGAYRVSSIEQPWRTDTQATIVLYPNNTALVTWTNYEQEQVQSHTGTGAWRELPDTAIVKVELTQDDGQAQTSPAYLDLTFDGDFIVDIRLNGLPASEAGYSFTLGAGDVHPAMRELNRRLAAVPWLNYTDPGPSGDVYAETTRQAALAFQESQGMLPTGIVDPATWLALAAPKPPGTAPTSAPPPTYEPVPAPTQTPARVPTRGIPTPTPEPPASTATPVPARTIPAPTPTRPPRGAAPKQVEPAPAACSPTAITTDDVRLRAAPSTNADQITTIPANTALAITARNAQGDWYQVTYNGQSGWSYATYLKTSCADGVPVLDVPTPTPRPQPAPPASQGQPAAGDKVVYLTFDDGPSAYTPQVLALLGQYNAKATFFMIGQQVSRLGETVKQVLGQGNDVGNHTWSHPSLAGLAEDVFNTQIMQTDAALREQGAFTQNVQHCLRPPYGATDQDTRDRAAKLGYRVVMWTIDTNDWRQPGASQIASTVLTQARTGSIVLMHDGGGNRQQSVAALEVVLQRLSQDGWRFETQCP